MLQPVPGHHGHVLVGNGRVDLEITVLQGDAQMG